MADTFNIDAIMRQALRDSTEADPTTEAEAVVAQIPADKAIETMTLLVREGLVLRACEDTIPGVSDVLSWAAPTD